MVFYRFIKKAIKFILYQLPKKWLVMIIFAFLMTFGLTQVKALDINSPNYVEFKYKNRWGTVSTYKIVCDSPCIIRPDNNNSSYFSCYLLSDNSTITNVAYYVNGSQYFSGNGAQFLGAMSSSSVSNITGGGDIKFYSSEDTLLYSNTTFTPPSITNTTSVIESYTFDYLLVSGGSLRSSTNYGDCSFVLQTNYMGISVLTDIDNYKSIIGGVVSFSIPKSELIDNPSVATGRSVNWELIYYEPVERR